MSVWPKLAVNVGGEFSWDANTDLTEFDADLDHLYDIGVRYVRVALPLWNGDALFPPTTHAKWRNMCALAKSKGFYVVWGLTTQFDSITSTTWSDIKDAFRAEAILADTSGNVDEFQLGNESEIKHDGSITDQTIQEDLATLAMTLKVTDGISMKLSYPIAQNNWGYWDDAGVAGMGGFDYVGLNVYGDDDDIDNFRQEIAKLKNTYGSKGKIYEWNIDTSWSESWITDSYFIRSKIALRTTLLKESGLSHEHYFFTWRYADDQFAMKKEDGTYSPLYYELTSSRAIA